MDTVGLFWNMVLVALASITVMFVYVSQGPTPQPSEEYKGEKMWRR